MKDLLINDKENTKESSSKVEIGVENLFTDNAPKLSNLEDFFRKYYEQHKPEYNSNSTKVPDIMAAMINNNEFAKAELAVWGSPELKASIFFRDNHNISIVPHMRYSPVFLHSHDFFEITYSFSGQCKYYIDDSNFVLEQDQMVLIAPGKAHAVISYDEDSRVINFLITSDYFRKMILTLLPETALTIDILHSLLNLGSSRGYITFDNKNGAVPRSTLVELISIYFSSSPHAAFMSELKIQEFFIKLSESQEKYISVGNSEHSSKSKAPASAIVRCLRNNYHSQSKQEIAAEFGYSERQLSRIIKSFSGKTYTELVQQFRTEDACRLLESTDMPISVISEQLGFNSTSSFYQCFSQAAGSTPNQYRKSHI